MWLTRLSIHNPVLATMMMLALMVLGIFSWQKLSVEEFPDIEYPYVMIVTDYPAASPEAVELEITRKLEDSINTIAGVRRIISTSYEGRSRIAVEFDLGVPITTAVQDVRDKVAAVKVKFRPEIKDPLVERYRPESSPIMSIAFQAQNLSARELTTVVEQQVVRRLQSVTGVGKVEVVGGVRREIAIHLQPERMQALGVGVGEVLAALRSDSADLPSGTVVNDVQEKVVQVEGRMIEPQDFARLVVAMRGQSPVYLEQVAEISDSEQEAQSLALVNGQRAVSIDIVKMTGANTLAVVDALRAASDELRPSLPTGVRMLEVADSAKSVRASLKEVQSTLIEGAILAVTVVFLFLGSWRSTVITSLTLPIALLGAVFGLYLCALTLNTMTLMALSLCIGLLIDDAIVVRENIVRHAAMGKSSYHAAMDGTREIGLAVLATTLTIVVVFLPVAFMGGIIGRFFYQFGVAVACAVLLSMFVSFTLDPMLSSIWHDPHEHKAPRTEDEKLNKFLQRFEKHQQPKTLVGQYVEQFLTRFDVTLEKFGQQYARVIRWALNHRRETLIVAFSSLFLAFFLAKFVGKEFVPEPDLSEISVKLATPVGSSLAYTQQKVEQIEAVIRSYDGVQATYATINSGMDAGKNKVGIRVRLVPKKERKVSQKELVSILRQRLSQMAGVEISSVAAAKESISGGLKPIQISLQGQDLNQLRTIAEEYQAKVSKIDGVVDLESSLKAARPAYAIKVDREKAADMGVSISQIGTALRPLLAGDAVTTWQDAQGENYDVRVQLSQTDRQNRDDIWALPLTSNRLVNANGQPEMVMLGEVARIDDAQGASQINRRNLYREVLFSANVQGRPAGDVGADMREVASQMQLPAGYRFQIQGQNKDMDESMGYAKTALILAVLFIYFVLGAQFNSFIHPLTIMSSLPLSLIGVFLALFVCRSTLNIFSLIGIVMLMGLVTKNAILLVDFIQHSIKEGMNREQAILVAARTRLRPILMTTAAMVVGMLPLALGLGEGSEQRAPMAHALIGGVLTSTILTLVVVPVLYTLFDDLSKVFKTKNTLSKATHSQGLEHK
ncbi:MAG TPA: efflux RND transporter permease subunit [Agitococcus sp.]|nr:efflux RND transporter permease subunit [Agitococcus sp.]HNG10820.1 efflux RND transporter permease subunit [Agitococcus sp.]